MGELVSCWGNALLELFEGDKESSGGLIIPDPAIAPRFTGRVVSVGPGRVTEEGKQYAPETSPGMVVETDRYRGYTIKYEGKKYYGMPEKMIACEYVDPDPTPSVFVPKEEGQDYEYLHRSMEPPADAGWEVHEYGTGKHVGEVRAYRRVINRR